MSLREVIVAVTTFLLPFSILGGRAGGNTEVDPHVSYHQDILEKRFTCGKNALYVLAHLCDIPVTLDEFESTTHPYLVESVESQGVSMLQLSQAGSAIGLPCIVRKLTADELGVAKLPVIAHFSTTVTGSSSGHFVVLVELTSDHVWYIDPTCATFIRHRADAFWSQWTGYMLQPVKKSPIRAAVFSDALLVVVASSFITIAAFVLLNPRVIRTIKKCSHSVDCKRSSVST